MKHSLIISLLFFSISLVKAELPFDVKISRGRIWVQKYSLGARSVFNDEERDEIIANSINTGTGSITIANFIPINVSTQVISVIEGMNNSGEIWGRSDTMKEIEKRMSSNYNLRKMAETKSLLSGYLILKNEGYGTTDQETKLTSDIERCKERINNPIK